MSHNFKKQFGQNFLKHGRFAEALVDALELPEHSQVIEIGPGDGRVTRILLDRGHAVTAIEVDYDLIPQLIRKFGESEKFQLVNEDVLELDMSKLFNQAEKPLFVVGSLPYNISKQIIFRLVNSGLPIKTMAFILQLEVAKEYAALAPEATFLSNWLRLFGEVRKLQTIPASQFFPQPKVDGAILRLRMQREGMSNEQRIRLAELLRVGFNQPRKTLRNNLISSDKWTGEQVDEVFTKSALKPTARPAELPEETWMLLYEKLATTD